MLEHSLPVAMSKDHGQAPQSEKKKRKERKPSLTTSTCKEHILLLSSGKRKKKYNNNVMMIDNRKKRRPRSETAAPADVSSPLLQASDRASSGDQSAGPTVRRQRVID